MGQIWRNPTDCCCVPSCLMDDCPNCSDDPVHCWQRVRFIGIANDDCDECTLFNDVMGGVGYGGFLLPHFSSCTWRTWLDDCGANDSVCSDPTSVNIITFAVHNQGGDLSLRVNIGGPDAVIILWEKPITTPPDCSTFDVTGLPHVRNWASMCDGAPATVHVKSVSTMCGA